MKGGKKVGDKRHGKYFHSLFNLYSNAAWTHKSLTGRWRVPGGEHSFLFKRSCLFFIVVLLIMLALKCILCTQLYPITT